MPTAELFYRGKDHRAFGLIKQVLRDGIGDTQNFFHHGAAFLQLFVSFSCAHAAPADKMLMVTNIQIRLMEPPLST